MELEVQCTGPPTLLNKCLCYIFLVRWIMLGYYGKVTYSCNTNTEGNTNNHGLAQYGAQVARTEGSLNIFSIYIECIEKHLVFSESITYTSPWAKDPNINHENCESLLNIKLIMKLHRHLVPLNQVSKFNYEPHLGDWRAQRLDISD